jgi:cytochrome c oxidase subunit 4
MSHDNTQAHGGGEHGHHVVPMKVYFGVFGTLLFLTVVTVAVAQVDLGPANMLVAMLVATIKASLVCAFFMQLKYDEKLNTIIFVFGLIFVALFFLFTLLDVFSRGFLDPRQDNLYMQKEAMQKLHYDLEQKANKPLPGVGLAADTPPKDELVPPPPPPSAPDGGVLPDGGIPAEGSAPPSDVAAPGSEAPVSAPASAAPASAAPASAAPSAP